MKISHLFCLTLLLTACNSETKNVSFQRANSNNSDAVFLNLNTINIEGQIKPLEVNNRIFLSYKLTHQYDTSSNSKLNKLLFLGSPLNYSHYSDNYDTVYRQVYSETRLKVDSLQKIIDNQPKRKKIKRPDGQVYDSDRMATLATDEEAALALMHPSLKDTNSLKDYATIIIERRNFARQQKTFPVFYFDPHFKTRTPSFNASYQIKLIDKDGFEIISYQTEKFLLKPFSNNLLEGKVEVNYKDLGKFKKDVFDKAAKVVVIILSAAQNGS